ncbi:MAG TPA: GNAT family N-acetyltransferase [Ktedonobacterales bacterium]|jgi:ribosomal protein S18 acetylase RimI-like enzyme
MENEDPTGLARAGTSDVRRIAALFARAFQDDPLMRYAIPDAQRRRRLLPRLMRLNVRYGCRYGEVYCTPEYTGAAIWLPPGDATYTLWRMLCAGMFVAPLRLPWPVLRRLAAVESRAQSLHERYAPDPHWYLAQIGVEPALQRQGIATRLLRPMLARIDSARLPCYLETENPANIPIYQRYGFQVAAEDAVPDGPRIWAMVR